MRPSCYRSSNFVVPSVATCRTASELVAGAPEGKANAVSIRSVKPPGNVNPVAAPTAPPLAKNARKIRAAWEGL